MARSSWQAQNIVATMKSARLLVCILLEHCFAPCCVSGCGCYAPPTPTAAAHAAPATAPPATPSTAAVSATASTAAAAAAATTAPPPAAASAKASATSQQYPAAEAAGAAKRYAERRRSSPKVSVRNTACDFFPVVPWRSVYERVANVGIELDGERMDTAGFAWLGLGTTAVAESASRLLLHISSTRVCAEVSQNAGTFRVDFDCTTFPHLPAGPCRQRLCTVFAFYMHDVPFARTANGPSTRQQPAQAGARSTPTTVPPAGAQQRGASSASSSSSPHVAQAAGQAAQQNQRKAPAPQRQAPRSQQHQHPSQV